MLRQRAAQPGGSAADVTGHPATELAEGLTDEELSQLIKNQAGFPPVLVVLIALFSFLVGLLF